MNYFYPAVNSDETAWEFLECMELCKECENGYSCNEGKCVANSELND